MPRIDFQQKLDFNQVLITPKRSTCTYIGAKCIKHMPKCTTFVLVSQQLNNMFK